MQERFSGRGTGSGIVQAFLTAPLFVVIDLMLLMGIKTGLEDVAEEGAKEAAKKKK